jgi:hypothetical protein
MIACLAGVETRLKEDACSPWCLLLMVVLLLLAPVAATEKYDQTVLG